MDAPASPPLRLARCLPALGAACALLTLAPSAFGQQPAAPVRVGIEVKPDSKAAAPPVEERRARVPQITLAPAATAGSAAPPAKALTLLNPGGEFIAIGLPAGSGSQSSLLLRYAAGFAGKKVVVNPIDGGTINGQRGTQVLSIAADGTLPLIFQCGGQPGTYSVVLRLDAVESSLRFVVPNTPVQAK